MYSKHMAQERHDNRVQEAAGETTGADLQGAFMAISRAPKERLLSITLKMSTSDPAAELVRAMALVVLNRQADALQLLQALKDHYIATYLASQVRASRGRLEDVKVDTLQLPEPRVATLWDLARIFQVLAQERLCEASLRDQAYQAVLLECKSNDNREEMPYAFRSYVNELIEEVKRVCGTEVSSKALLLWSDSPHILSESSHSYPSSLQSASYSSLPSHLEISAAPTQPVRGASPTHTRVSQQTSTHTRASHQASHTGGFSAPAAVGEVEGCLGPTSGHRGDAVAGHGGASPDHSRSAPATLEEPTRLPVQSAGQNGTQQLVTSISTGMENLSLPESGHLKFSRSVSAPEPRLSCEEAVFYAFVILHAPEDADVAEELKEKLECATSGMGATYSQDFAIPGKSTLTCLDDAIDNSAFTILLLTQNFNSRMQEVFADSALINSIDQAHKNNSVIPLYPLKNPLPSGKLHKALKIFIALHESSRNFSNIARRAISPEKVARQRQRWDKSQEEKRHRESRQRLQEENRRREEQIHQAERMKQLEQEAWELYQRQQNLQGPTLNPPFHPLAPGMGATPPGFQPNYPPWPPQRNPYSFGSHTLQAQPVHYPPNISIHNAQCIMIGNDSTMTIGDPGVLQSDLDED